MWFCITQEFLSWLHNFIELDTHTEFTNEPTLNKRSFPVIWLYISNFMVRSGLDLHVWVIRVGEIRRCPDSVRIYYAVSVSQYLKFSVGRVFECPDLNLILTIRHRTVIPDRNRTALSADFLEFLTRRSDESILGSLSEFCLCASSSGNMSFLGSHLEQRCFDKRCLPVRNEFQDVLET